MTDCSNFSKPDGTPPSNIGSNPCLSDEGYSDITEPGITPEMRTSRLIEWLTEGPTAAVQATNSGIGIHELALRGIFTKHENGEDLHELYNDFEIAMAQAEAAARYDGWVMGMAHAIQNLNAGLTEGNPDDLAIDWPFPHGPLPGLVDQFGALASGEANKHLSQIYALTIKETQAVHVACYKLGYQHGAAIWGHVGYVGVVRESA